MWPCHDSIPFTGWNRLIRTIVFVYPLSHNAFISKMTISLFLQPELVFSKIISFRESTWHKLVSLWGTISNRARSIRISEYFFLTKQVFVYLSKTDPFVTVHKPVKINVKSRPIATLWKAQSRTGATFCFFHVKHPNGLFQLRYEFGNLFLHGIHGKSLGLETKTFCWMIWAMGWQSAHQFISKRNLWGCIQS